MRIEKLKRVFVGRSFTVDYFFDNSVWIEPYKRANTLIEALEIMEIIKKERILMLSFLKEGVYHSDADEYLSVQQMDEVEIRQYLI